MANASLVGDLARSSIRETFRDMLANAMPIFGGNTAGFINVFTERMTGKKLAMPPLQDATHLSQGEYEQHKAILLKLSSATYNPFTIAFDMFKKLFGGSTKREKLITELGKFAESANLPYGSVNYANDAIFFLSSMLATMVKKYGPMKRIFSPAKLRGDPYIKAVADALKAWIKRVDLQHPASGGVVALKQVKADLETLPEFLAGHDRRYPEAPGALATQLVAQAEMMAARSRFQGQRMNHQAPTAMP